MQIGVNETFKTFVYRDLFTYFVNKKMYVNTLKLSTFKIVLIFLQECMPYLF